jgi:hypothetical protein
MEFYINHTLQEIARTPSEDWEEDDHIEKTTISLEIEEDFFAMVKLIDDYAYMICEEDRQLFMHDIELERKMNEQYEAMLKQADDDSGSVGSWKGWDEPGAAFDH